MTVHYNGWECYDSIKTELSDDEMRGALRFNIRKYLWRYRAKNGVDDLVKARSYLDQLIKLENDLKNRDIQ